MYQYVLLDMHRDGRPEVSGFFPTEESAIIRAKQLAKAVGDGAQYRVAKIILQVVPPSPEPIVTRFE